ncbi:MAG: aminodeoxychorismate synthase component I [Legionellaceae bacterium]|nr:aminodeoxychorismate synthase component I [Legionellaceae bacterium]
MKTLIIDNYDSFTYNLYQMIAEINGELPIVIQNDSHDIEDIASIEYDNIIISPGPGHPDKATDFGICARILLESTVPILGVCLGHQGICSVFGGAVIHAFEPMHGRLSTIQHTGDVLFTDIPNQFNVVRYHSLVSHETLPDCLEITATTLDGVIMGVRHRTRPIWGVQYHPESICTEHGKQLLTNFMRITDRNHIVVDRIKIGHHDERIQKQTSHQLKVKKLVKSYDPERAFTHLLNHAADTVWLDSSRIIPDISRFSFMGCLNGPLSFSVRYDVNTNIIIRRQGRDETQLSMSIFDYLNEELSHYAIPAYDLPFQFHCGFIGYFGYELYTLTLGIPAGHASKYPDSQFLFLDRVIVFDHDEQACYLLALIQDDSDLLYQSWFEETEQLLEASNDLSEPCHDSPSSTGNYSLSRDHDTYIDDINRCLNHIRDGESYEICLTNKLHFNCKVNPYSYYTALRKVNPAPYSAFIHFGDLAIACSSIERYLLIDPERHVETKPIKGTLPRGKTIVEDDELIDKLQHDEKFKAENLMIVDLLRHDLGKVCEISSVHVPSLMNVETYETVHQLVSTIRGKLKSDMSAIDCIVASFPGGSMTGAPKIRTVEIINTLETEARGIYSGSIGYLSLNGSLDLNIVIRTAVITPEQLSIGVGGAIIALSDPEDEYQETFLKSKSLQKALAIRN